MVSKNFFTNPDVIENVRPQLAPVIPASAPITVANDAIEIVLVATDKKLMITKILRRSNILTKIVAY